MTAPAVVLLSGGLDSATALAIAAKRDGRVCHTLAVDYGQRHRSELDAAARVSAGANSASHRTVAVDLRAFGGSALTADIDVPVTPTSGIPVTYVPARNTIFLALALGYAEVLSADAIYLGINAVDYSGYPDCRPEFVQAFQRVADVATKAATENQAVTIRAPLLNLGKADIIRLGLELDVDYRQSVSCYQADAEGRACGRCDSCRIRRAGFVQAGATDPTRYVNGA